MVSEGMDAPACPGDAGEREGAAEAKGTINNI